MDDAHTQILHGCQPHRNALIVSMMHPRLRQGLVSEASAVDATFVTNDRSPHCFTVTKADGDDLAHRTRSKCAALWREVCESAKAHETAEALLGSKASIRPGSVLSNDSVGLQGLSQKPCRKSPRRNARICEPMRWRLALSHGQLRP